MKEGTVFERFHFLVLTRPCIHNWRVRKGLGLRLVESEARMGEKMVLSFIHEYYGLKKQKRHP
jgi:hypothetical protein